MSLTFGSLFAGIGGFDLGFERAGMQCKWQVEIDPWCRAVLTKHWPNVPKYDDIRLLVGGDVPGTLKKLTTDQVEEAIRLYEGGLSLGEVAQFFGVSRQSMWDLLRRRIELRPQLRFGEENHFYRGGEVQDDRAQNVLEKAVARGAVIPEDVCENCGNAPPPFADGRRAIQAHHDDYNKPLEVRWLCQRCHHEWHQEHRAVPRLEVPVEPVDVLVGGFPSRARTSASPAKGPAYPESDPVYGSNMPESWARYDPDTSLWRTSQRCLTGEWAEWSATWPRSGMTRSGRLYPRAPWVRHTHVSACGSLPTPQAIDWKGSCEKLRHKRHTTYHLKHWTHGTALAIHSATGLSSWPNPTFVEWLMGLPGGWTDLSCGSRP